MNKDQAIHAATGGKFVKRKEWPDGSYIFASDGRIYFAQKDKAPELYKIHNTIENGKVVKRNPDRTAQDWELTEGRVLPIETEVKPLSAIFVNNKADRKPQQL